MIIHKYYTLGNVNGHYLVIDANIKPLLHLHITFYIVLHVSNALTYNLNCFACQQRYRLAVG